MHYKKEKKSKVIELGNNLRYLSQMIQNSNKIVTLYKKQEMNLALKKFFNHFFSCNRTAKR